MPRKLSDDLSDRQRDMLVLIDSHIDKHCFPPTVRDLCRATGTTTNAVAEMLERLERKGFITKRKKLSRSIAIADRWKKERR